MELPIRNKILEKTFTDIYDRCYDGVETVKDREDLYRFAESVVVVILSKGGYDKFYDRGNPYDK